MKKDVMWMLAASIFISFAVAACDDDENVGGDDTTTDVAEQYVIAATEDEATYLIQSDAIDASAPGLSTQGVGNELEAATHWLFPQDKYAYGLQYNQGNAGECVSFVLNAQGKLEKRSKAMEMPRFTAFGVHEQYIILGASAATAFKDEDGNAKYGVEFTVIDAEQQSYTTQVLVTENLLGDKQYCTVSGFVSVGDKIYTAICPSGFSAYGIAQGIPSEYDDLITEGGRNSTGKSIANPVYPNSVHIGIFNGVHNFSNEPLKIVEDTRVSLAASKFRSQYYSTIEIGENGYLYVFSNSYSKANTDERITTTHPAGVVRLNTATDEFDSYYCNIEEITQQALGKAHSFFQVWHMGGDKFLMRLYDNEVPDFTFNAINTFGIFDAQAKTYTPLTGMPQLNNISEIGRFAYTENGKIYLPVTLLNGTPTVYIIDAATATATPGVTVSANKGISAIWKMHN